MWKKWEQIITSGKNMWNVKKRRVLSTEFTFWQMGGENGSKVGRNEISKKSESSPGKK